jgi:CBS domain-containing protein
MRFMLTDDSARGLEQVCAHEVMSSRLISIKPETTISTAARLMIGENISSLAVIGDQLEGIVTKADIVDYLGATNRRTQSVDLFMTSIPITVRTSQSVLSIIRLMSLNKISRVVVVDQSYEPEGIITMADFALLLLSFCFGRIPASDFLKRTEAIGLSARDFMTWDPVTVDQSSDLSEAARLMTKHHISGLPVTDSCAKLAGIVSKTDITRVVANATEASHLMLDQSFIMQGSRTCFLRRQEEMLSAH